MADRSIKDANNVSTIIGVDSSTFLVPTTVAVNPSTHALKTEVSGAGSGGTSATDKSTFTASSTAGTPSMGAYEASPTTVTDGQVAIVGIDSSRAMKVHVTANDVAAGGTSAADGAAWVASTTTGTPLMGARDDSSPATVAEDKVGIARITTNRALHVNIRDAAGTEYGTSGSPLQVSLANTGANGTAVKVDNSAVTQPTSILDLQKNLVDLNALRVQSSQFSILQSNVLSSPQTASGNHVMAYDGSETLYFFKPGNVNSSLFSFNIRTKTLTTLSTSLPDTYDGASIIYAGGFLYYSRGGAFTTFYRVNTDGTGNTAMTVSNLAINFASAMVYDGSDLIYLRTNAGFEKYSIGGNSWTTLTSPSASATEGCSLVLVGSQRIYSLQGGGTTTFEMYKIGNTSGNTDANTWTTKTPLPGNVYDGGGLAWNGDNFIYTTQGNGSQNFYRYDLNASAWQTLPLLPMPASTGSTILTANNNGFFLYVVEPSNLNTTSFGTVNNLYFYDPTQATLDATMQGTLASTASVTLNSLPGTGTIALQITGTWVATLQFEATINGTDWFSAAGIWIPIGQGSSQNTTQSTTVVGQWMFSNYGFAQFRVRCSAYTSGTALIAVRATNGSVPIAHLDQFGIQDINAYGNGGVKLQQNSADGYGLLVGGGLAAGTTDAGNPVKIGGYASTTVPTAVTAAQRVNAWFDLNGRLRITGDSSMTALKVDGSAVTQPVSNTGTFAVQPGDGTNTGNVLKSDGTAAGQNAQIIAGTGYSTGTLTLNLASPNTAWFDMLNYSWVSVEVLTNSSSATLTFQTSGDSSQTNISNTILINSSSVQSTPSASTTTATQTWHGPRSGRYFRISSNVSGANTATLVITFHTIPSVLGALGVNSSQSGTWTVQPGNTANTTAWKIVQANDAGKTIVSKTGSASSSGNNTLVTAGTNKLKVFAFSLSTSSTTALTVKFQDGASGTDLWSVILQAPTSVSTGANLSVSPPAYLFATSAATLLNLNISSANAVQWSVSYFDEA